MISLANKKHLNCPVLDKFKTGVFFKYFNKLKTLELKLTTIPKKYAAMFFPEVSIAYKTCHLSELKLTVHSFSLFMNHIPDMILLQELSIDFCGVNSGNMIVMS